MAYVTPARAHSGTAQFAHGFLVAVRWTSGTVWGRGGKGVGGRGGVDVPRVFLCFKDELQNTLEQSLRRLMSPLHTTTYNEKYTEREYQPTFKYIR